MKVETRKVPPVVSGNSLIGVGSKRPCSWGNYFWLDIDGESVRVLNMWLENLEHASKKYFKGDDVQVRLYTHVYDENGEDRSWCLIDDERIPKDYYYNKLCYTGGSRPPKDLAKDMYEHVGDPENEFEQFTDPVTYFAKRGGEYNPKTGIVYYGRKTPGGIFLPTSK